MRQDTKRRLFQLEDSVELLTRLMETPNRHNDKVLNQLLEEMLNHMRALAEEHEKIAHINAVHCHTFTG